MEMAVQGCARDSFVKTFVLSDVKLFILTLCYRSDIKSLQYL